MTTVINLLPGDRVPSPFGAATYVQQAEHPIWPHLRLVVWRLWDGTWSHDALSPQQDVGAAQIATPAERMLALRGALLGSASDATSPAGSADAADKIDAPSSPSTSEETA